MWFWIGVTTGICVCAAYTGDVRLWQIAAGYAAGGLAFLPAVAGHKRITAIPDRPRVIDTRLATCQDTGMSSTTPTVADLLNDAKHLAGLHPTGFTRGDFGR